MSCARSCIVSRKTQSNEDNTVQIHQNNYLKIQKLRQSSAALDTQIRDTLTSLANTRKDIVTTHTTTYPSEPNFPIAYGELLSYARRISKTTLPPAATIESAATPPETQSPNPELQTQSALTPSARTPSRPTEPSCQWHLTDDDVPGYAAASGQLEHEPAGWYEPIP